MHQSLEWPYKFPRGYRGHLLQATHSTYKLYKRIERMNRKEIRHLVVINTYKKKTNSLYTNVWILETYE